MKITKSVLITKIIAAMFFATIIVSNVFVLRGLAFGMNSYNNVAAREVADYLKAEKETKTFGKVDSVDDSKYPVAGTDAFIKIARSMASGSNQRQTNKTYFISKPSENYTPLKITLDETVFSPTVIISPDSSAQNLKHFYDFKFITQISENYPENANTILLPKNIADMFITQEDAEQNGYGSLLEKEIEVDTYFQGIENKSILTIAGVFDNLSAENKFYVDAFESYVIAPFSSAKQLYSNTSLIFELGKNKSANANYLKFMHERLYMKEGFTWGIYQKNSNGNYALGKIDSSFRNSYVFFVNNKGWNDAVTCFIISACSGLLSIVMASILYKRYKKTKGFFSKNARELLMGIFIIGLLGSTLIMFSLKGLPISEGINVPYDGAWQSVISIAVMVILFLIISIGVPIICKDKKMKVVRKK